MKLHDIRCMIEETGLVLVSIERNRHWKAEVETPSGDRCKVTFPTSLSDNRRGLKNKAAQLRAIARGVMK